MSLVASPDEAELAKRGARGVGIAVHPDSEDLAEIARLIDAGKIKPVVTEVLPLREAVKALEQAETHHTRGKLVLKIADPPALVVADEGAPKNVGRDRASLREAGAGHGRARQGLRGRLLRAAGVEGGGGEGKEAAGGDSRRGDGSVRQRLATARAGDRDRTSAPRLPGEAALRARGAGPHRARREDEIRSGIARALRRGRARPRTKRISRKSSINWSRRFPEKVRSGRATKNGESSSSSRAKNSTPSFNSRSKPAANGRWRTSNCRLTRASRSNT